MKYKKTFTIDRSRWARGGVRLMDEVGKTQLLNAQGNSCCLGQIALQCGFSEHRIRERTNPSEVVRFRGESTGFLTTVLAVDHRRVYDTELAWQLTRANDHVEISDRVREQRITFLLRDAGYNVKFVGKYVGGEIK